MRTVKEMRGDGDEICGVVAERRAIDRRGKELEVGEEGGRTGCEGKEKSRTEEGRKR